MGDTWRGVETSTRKTDQGVTVPDNIMYNAMHKSMFLLRPQELQMTLWFERPL